MDIDFFIIITIYLLIILLIHYYVNKSNTTKITPCKFKKKILKLNNVNDNLELDTNTFDDFASQSTQSTQSNNNSESDLIINSTELDTLNSINNKDELLKYLDIEKKEKEETISNINSSYDNKSLNDYFTESNKKYDFLEVPTLDDVNVEELKKLNETTDSDKLFGNVLAFDDFDDNHALVA